MTKKIVENPIPWLIGSLGLFYVIVFTPNWVPTRDTLDSMWWSHHFFSSIGHFNDPGFWSPTSNWGKSVRLQFLVLLNPTLIFLLPITKLFPSMHITSLHFISYFFDDLILLFGTYALARHLFKDVLIVLLVTTSMLFTSFWSAQVFFNFHLFYVLPFCFYWILLGIEKRERYYWVFTINVLAVSSIFGTLLYTGIMQGFFVAVFTVAALVYFKDSKRGFRWGWKSWFGIGCLVLILALALGFLNSATLPAFLSRERAADGSTTYTGFLNYGGPGTLRSFNSILDGIKVNEDASMYSGIILFPFFLMGIFFSENKLRFPFLFTAVISLLLYCGGASVVAPIVYALPMAKYFRHLGNTIPFFKMTLVILAGFGFEHFLRCLKTKDFLELARLRKLTLWILGVTFVCIGFQWGVPTSHKFLAVVYTAIFFFLFYRIDPVNDRLLRALPLVIVMVSWINVLNWRSAKLHEEMLEITVEEKSLFRMHPIPPRLERDDPDDALAALHRSGLLHTKLERFQLTDAFSLVFDIDPCARIARSDTVQANARYLYAITQGDLPEGLRKVLACRSSKLLVFDSLQVQSTPESIEEILKASQRPALMVSASEWDRFRKIHLGPLPPTQTIKTVRGQQPVAAKIEIIKFAPSSQTFRVTVPVANQSYWLYYSDAWDPLWRARVNGNEVDLLNANAAFKAIPISSGTSLVEFQYGSSRDLLWIVGFWVCSVLFVSVFVYWCRRTLYHVS